MNILAFDTCFDACSAAVVRADTGLVTTERELMRRGHAEALMPMIDRAMAAAGLEYGELDRIAVTNGPGTFTGSRVGMSAALGLAFAHCLPVVTYSSLQCVARAVLDVLADQVAQFDGILVARDAKRDSVFVETTNLSGGEIRAPARRGLVEARQLAAERRWLVVGSGATLLMSRQSAGARERQLAGGTSKPLPPDIFEADCRYMLADAASRQPTQILTPLYLRPPDATPSSQPPLARLTASVPFDA